MDAIVADVEACTAVGHKILAYIDDISSESFQLLSLHTAALVQFLENPQKALPESTPKHSFNSSVAAIRSLFEAVLSLVRQDLDVRLDDPIAAMAAYEAAAASRQKQFAEQFKALVAAAEPFKEWSKTKGIPQINCIQPRLVLDLLDGDDIIDDIENIGVADTVESVIKAEMQAVGSIKDIVANKDSLSLNFQICIETKIGQQHSITNTDHPTSSFWFPNKLSNQLPLSR
eukprot:jgi/Hompol1/379/HPOL_000237-RA